MPTAPSGWLCCSKSAKLLLLFLLCATIYVYLYTRISGEFKTQSVLKLVEGRWHAFWSGDLKILFSSKNSLSDLTQSSGNVWNSSESNTTELEKDWMSKYNKSPHLLTLFTSWTRDPDKFIVHNNTIRNWLSLKPYVRAVIFTNEADLESQCRKSGWDVMPVSVEAKGIPVLKYMYLDAMRNFTSDFYAYVNGDILFTDSLVQTLLFLNNSSELPKDVPIFIIGIRTNVRDVSREMAGSWENITRAAKEKGKLFQTYAEDYFVTTESYPWKDIPAVVIGRRAYDNWLVMNARKLKQTVVDISLTNLALHQTTKAGDFEGHSHKDGEYNHRLLVKLYKRIRYEAGSTACARWHTKYNSAGEIELVKRQTIPKTCSPV